MKQPNLSTLSTVHLERELRERRKAMQSLIRKREKLAARARELDEAIQKLGGSVSALGGTIGLRKRPRNDQNLVESLVKLLTGKTMGVTEAAIAVQKAGYKTTSPNFRTIVNQALIKDKRFKRASRGKYTVRS